MNEHPPQDGKEKESVPSGVKQPVVSVVDLDLSDESAAEYARRRKIIVRAALMTQNQSGTDFRFLSPDSKEPLSPEEDQQFTNLMSDPKTRKATMKGARDYIGMFIKGKNK